MKRKIFNLSLMALAAAFLFTACKDDDDDDNKPAPSVEQRLARDWRTTSVVEEIYFNGNLVSSIDYFAFYEECDKDDIERILSNGTYALLEGDVKCDPADSDTIETGTWMLINNKSKLVVADTSGWSDTLNIINLSTSSANLSIEYTEADTNYVVKIGWQAL